MNECEDGIRIKKKKQPSRKRKSIYKGPNDILYKSFLDFRISLKARSINRFPKTVENLIRYCNQNNCKLIILNLEDSSDTTFLSDFEIPVGKLSFDS
jgi:hypothetical protein